MAKTKEKIDLDGILSDVKKGKFAPIYFFYGEEDFLIEEAVDTIVANAVDSSMKEFNCDIVYGNDIDAKKLVSIASSFPMMAERRVVVVKNFDKMPLQEKERELIEHYIENPSQSTILVLTALNPDFRRKPYTTLKKNSIGGECASLKEFQIPHFIESRAKKMKISIEPQAAAMLQSFVGTSLREIVNEMEKLIIYIGARASITKDDVQKAVGVSREFTPFELSNMLGEKNMAKAQEIASRILSSGESAIPVIAALSSHFVKVWKISDGLRQRKPESELAQYAGVSPFYLKQYVTHAKNYTPQQLENIFLVLADADFAVKNSADPKLVLTTAVTSIINGIALEEIA